MDNEVITTIQETFKNMTRKKNILINQIDVKYREIENNDFQYQIMHKILSKFENTDLQKILKTCNIVQKQDALYNRK